MPLIQRISESRGRRRIYSILFIAVLSVFAAAFENLIPRPLPYVKIGIAFAVILPLISVFRIYELWLLAVAKAIVVSIIFANIFTPPFFLGLAGALLSLSVMKLLYSTGLFTLIGISCAGAVMSNLAQYFTAKLFFGFSGLSMIVPVLILFSLVSGAVIGIAAQMLRKAFEEE